MTWAFQDVEVYVNLEEGDVEDVDEVFVRTFAEALDTSYSGAYNAGRMGSMRANQALKASEVASVVEFAEVGACLTVEHCRDDAQVVGLIDQQGGGKLYKGMGLAAIVV